MTAMPQDLNALIGSRICHDLISPLGAIGNGVELLAMSGDATGPEMGLIAQSVENANARIRYFRVAFGAAKPGQPIGHTEVRSILSDLAQGSRVSYDWQPTTDAARPTVKLIFLLIQCFESAMPRGGLISVSHVGTQWAVTGEADKLLIKPDRWHMLSAPDAEMEIDAADVHFALAPLAAARIGRRLTVESSETVARVRF